MKKLLLVAMVLALTCTTANAALLPPKPTAKQEVAAAAAPCPWLISGGGVWDRFMEWINPWMIS